MRSILHVETPIIRSELAGEPVGEFERTGRREWFEIRPIGGMVGGRESVQGQQLQASVSHELKCHFFAGANSAMRLTAGEDARNPSRVFNVVSVANENEDNRRLVWQCTEVT